MSNSEALWIVTCQGLLSMGILQERMLDWIAMPSSRGSSRPRDRTPSLLHLPHWQGGSLPLAPPGTRLLVLSALLPLPPRVWVFRGEPWFYVPCDPLWELLRGSLPTSEGSCDEASVEDSVLSV